MARVNEAGGVAAGCSRCHGALSTFEWKIQDHELGAVVEAFDDSRMQRQFRLFRCAGWVGAVSASSPSLEKTLIAAGYKVKRENLFEQIEAAATDGTITEARRRRAHDEIRVLGNDVLHDVWREISDEEVTLARDYTQRIIEDFYDHRSSTLAQLRAKGRIPTEDIAVAAAP